MSATASERDVWVVEIGRISYGDGLLLQEGVAAARRIGELPDVLLLLEHDPVFTHGRRTDPGDLPMGAQWYRERGIEICETDRGGQVTYHAPGQLVAYPIVALEGGERDLHAYVRGLERAMIGALADFAVPAQVIDGLTGVWTAGRPPIPPGMPGPQRTPVGEPSLEGAEPARKLGAIGIHVSRWITTHGLALNVDCDLTPFEWVVPCGIEASAASSIEGETGSSPGVEAVGEQVAGQVARELGRRPIARDASDLPAPAMRSDQGGKSA